MVPSKKPRNSLKSISNIEVPRTIKQELIKKESTEEESQFDVNGERKKRRGRNKKEKIYFSKKTDYSVLLVFPFKCLCFGG